MTGAESNVFDNPILTGSRLIEGYRASVGRSLVESGLPDRFLDEVLATLQLGSGTDLESTLWLTRRRPFVRDQEPLVNVAPELGISSDVAQAFASTVASLWAHQRQAIRSVLAGVDTIIATGTGSGKTEAFLIPVVELCYRSRRTPGVKAIVVYPRNALVEDQHRRIKEQYLQNLPVTVAAYTGAMSEEERDRVLRCPPDILLTNHVMLERVLVRPERRPLVGKGTLEIVVLDELHTFRGNAGADTAWLLKRLAARSSTQPIFVGASATLDDQPFDHRLDPLPEEQTSDAVAMFARNLFSLGGTDSSRKPTEVIRPTYSTEESSGGEFPDPDWTRLPGWHHDFGDHGALLVESFFNLSPGAARGVGRLRLGFDLSARLNDHALVRGWKNALLSPRQFSELVAACDDIYRKCLGRQCPDARRLTESALQLIALDRNDVARTGGRREPVMNLVTHIMTRGLEGPLMVCIQCGKHHVGPETLCPDSDCAQSLTLAFSSDPRRGLMSADAGDWLLNPIYSASDRVTSSTLLVSKEDLPRPGRTRHMRARLEQTRVDALSYRFVPDEQGPFLLEQLGEPPTTAMNSMPIVRTTLTRHNLEHFLDMTWHMLQVEGRNSRLLVFSNQRDRAAHVGYMLKADRADRHFSWLALRQGFDLIDFTRASEFLNPPVEGGEHMRELVEAAPIWLARLCATSARLHPDHKGSLAFSSLEDFKKLSPCEQQLLQLCLSDGVIDWADLIGDCELPSRPAIFHYDRRWRTQHPRLTLQSGGSTDPRDRAIKLTANANAVHHELVEEFGGEAITAAIDSLVANRWLLSGSTQRGLAGYRLAPGRLALGPRIRRLAHGAEQFFGVGVHSSDTDAQSRAQIERSFKEPGSGMAQISATSTLELGVDIGSLQHVACYGLPPSPASFAQRSGRAGRGTSARYALVLTWAESWSETESRLIRDAEELRSLLNGSALVPQIDPMNPAIASRHLFAEVLAIDWSIRSGPVSQIDSRLVEAASKIPSDVLVQADTHKLAHLLRTRLAPWLVDQFEHGTSNIREAFYQSIYAPDYGFPRATVGIVNADFQENAGIDQNQTNVNRSPSQAIRILYPGALIRLPAGIGRIGDPEKKGDPIRLPTGRVIERVEAFTVNEDRDGIVRLDDTKETYDVRCLVVSEPDQVGRLNEYGWFRWQVDRGSRLVIANLGPKYTDAQDVGDLATQNLRTDGKPDSDFAWGYEVFADALKLQFNVQLLDNESIAAVLGSLSLAIQRRYSLSDEDFTVLPELEENESGPTGRFALTDIGGRNLLPLHRLEDDFDQCIADAYAVAVACRCRDGCFRCVRSQPTRYMFPLASKARAIELVGALLGDCWFRPSLPRRPSLGVMPPSDSIPIELRLAGSPGNQKVSWNTSSSNGVVPLGERLESAALLEGLQQALVGVGAGATVTLATNRDYIRNYLSGTSPTRRVDPEWRWLGLKYRWLSPRS